MKIGNETDFGALIFSTANLFSGAAPINIASQLLLSAKVTVVLSEKLKFVK